MKILLIEDEKLIQNALRMSLEREGYTVTTADNGKEGLVEIVKDVWDIVLLDLILPEYTGFEILEKVKDKNLKSPIIVLSNLSQSEEIDKAKSFGIKDFIIKANIDLSSVSEKIRQIVNEK